MNYLAKPNCGRHCITNNSAMLQRIWHQVKYFLMGRYFFITIKDAHVKVR